MWPWEHLAVGYLTYSLYARLVHGERPGNADTAVLAFATQFPDLVDKPLAWTLGVLPSGVSLAHSLLFAVPVCLLVVVAARVAGRPAIGRAFAIGYLTHPFADVLYNAITGGSVDAGFLLWPLVSSPRVAPPGLLSQVRLFLDSFVEFLATPTGQLYLVFELALLLAALAVWVVDKYPGWGLVRRGARRVTGRDGRGG